MTHFRSTAWKRGHGQAGGPSYLIILGLLLAGGLAANWPQWRGPNQNGTAPRARDLPVKFSDTENVLWRVKLPNWSAATPAVWGDQILLTSSEEGFVRLQGQG